MTASLEGATRTRVAQLEITSGRIAAADPLTSSGFEPFVRAVPNGSWPVELLLATNAGDTRVARASVVFRDEEPVRFEMAVTAGQDPRTLKAEEHFGYGVDSGTGCFADAEAMLDGERLVASLQKRQETTWSWAAEGDVVAFSSGYGDGVYSSYFGLDAQGEPVCLVTDFGIFDFEVPVHATDVEYRRREAERLFGDLLEKLPLLGSQRHGEAYEAASKLNSLREDAALTAPRLLDMLSSTDNEMEKDLLAYALGGLLGHEGGDAALAAAMPRLSDDDLAALLEKRRPPRDAVLLPELVAAWMTRWPAANSAARAGILNGLMPFSSRAMHPAFGALATEAVQSAVASPSSEGASDLVSAAIEPYRVQQARSIGEGSAPVFVAPPELVALLGAVAMSVRDHERRSVVQVMVLQGAHAQAAALLRDASSPLRYIAAVALASEPAFQAPSLALLRAAIADPSHDEEARFSFIDSLPEPEERAAAYLDLAMGGARTGVIQLGYLLREAPEAARAALERLKREAPQAKVRSDAKDTLKRIKA